MPQTSSGRDVSIASSTTGSVEVLVAKMASRRVSRSSSKKRAFLTARSSTTDSITRSQSARSSSSPVARDPRSGCPRPPPRCASRARPGGRGTSRGPRACRRRSTVERLRTTTSQPDAAATSAMPRPMIPDPTTPTRSITSESYRPVTLAANGVGADDAPPDGEAQVLGSRSAGPQRIRRLELAVATSRPCRRRWSASANATRRPTLRRDARRAQRAALEGDRPQVAHR